MQHNSLNGLFKVNIESEFALPFAIRALIFVHLISYVSFKRGKRDVGSLSPRISRASEQRILFEKKCVRG